MFIWGGNSAPVGREECCCPRELYGEKAGEKDGENTALSVPDKGGSSGDAEIDHEASAALLMLNMDRRGIESVTVPQAESASEPTLKATMTTLSTNSTLPVILPRSRRPEESENDAVGRVNTSFTTVSESSDVLPNRKRKKVGMSVRDLLVS